MIQVADHYLIPKVLLQQVVSLVRCCQPTGMTSNGDVIDLMGMLGECIRQQEEKSPSEPPAAVTAAADPPPNGDPVAATPEPLDKARRIPRKIETPQA